MKHLRIFGLLALLAAFSCTKNHAEGSGQVFFSLNSDLEIAEQTRSSVSQYTALPSTGDFTVSITNASSNTAVWTGKISDWDSSTPLPVGSYKVSATYGSLEDEGFDKPFFTGSSDFTVVGNKTTEVKVNVTLGNTVVLVSCTDAFRNYYKDYSFKLTRNGADIVTFVKNEARAAFVDGYKFTLEGTVTGPTGKTSAFSKDYASLNEATAYTLKFDVSNVGGAAITVTFNNNVETIELGDVELND